MRSRNRAQKCREVPGLVGFLAVTLGILADAGPIRGLADPASDAAEALKKSGLPNVTVTAPHIDRGTLDHVVIPEFVASHAIATERVNQVGRWYENICPETRGLEPLSSEFVSRRLVAIARMVGAPTVRSGYCRTNVEVQFTQKPQEFVQAIAKQQPALLGYTEGRLDELARLDHPIKAWSVTATRSFAAAAPSGVDLLSPDCGEATDPRASRQRTSPT